MSDYYTSAGFTKDRMAELLSNKPEHFTYVLLNALQDVDLKQALEAGCRPEYVDIKSVKSKLQEIIDELDNMGTR